MLTALAVSGYRSLRDVVVPLSGLNLVTGANGSGKSNLYRALRLLADVAQGRAIASLAQEGGLSSVLWAGPEGSNLSMRQGYHAVQGTRRKGPVSLKLGFASDDFGYAIDLGLPVPGGSVFDHDPEIKREVVWSGPALRPSAVLVDRRGPFVRSRADGDWLSLTQGLSTFDSMMTHCADPRSTPEMLLLREQIRGWRFYDHFRTDAASPARLPQIGTHTPVLGHDGRDLAAALETIRMIGDHEALAAAIDDAFPGSQVSVRVTDGWFSVEMQQHGLLRPLGAGELSDGTLRYLLWIAALLTPRPPQLLVLNEPETSLHPDLLPALGRLIVQAARRSQVIAVSHAGGLIDALQSEPECHAIVLRKDFGDTQVEGTLAPPRWEWPAR
jgi:predicted ATPase